MPQDNSAKDIYQKSQRQGRYRRRIRPSSARRRCRNLLKYSGHTQREIAKLLNLSRGATVSKQIIRCRKLIAENRELRSQVETCEKRLNELRVT